MKKVLFAVLIVIPGLTMLAQDFHFPASIVSAGGSTIDGSAVNFSGWRIGQVHVLTLPIDLSEKETMQDWNVSAYPNPVKDFLQLEFELPEAREFFLKVTDASGKVAFIQEARPFINGSISEIDLSDCPPALYLLQVSSIDLRSQRVLRVQKL